MPVATDKSHGVLSTAHNGRVLIPADVRKAFNFEAGEDLLYVIEDGSLRLTTRREAIRRAQRRVAQYIPADKKGTLVDAFIADRRSEAAAE